MTSPTSSGATMLFWSSKEVSIASIVLWQSLLFVKDAYDPIVASDCCLWERSWNFFGTLLLEGVGAAIHQYINGSTWNIKGI